MTKTINELVYSIKEAVYNHAIPDDANIENEFIIGKINDINASLVREYSDSGRNLDGFYQKVCCIEIECEKQTCTLDGKVIDSGDVIWKTNLPALHKGIGEKSIKYLGNKDLSVEYTRMSFEGFKSSGGRVWTSTKPLYTVINDEAILKNIPESGAKFLCMIAILADPTSACNWENDTSMYPTPSPQKLELVVVQSILGSLGIRKDEIQDSRDGVAEGQVKQKSNE